MLLANFMICKQMNANLVDMDFISQEKVSFHVLHVALEKPLALKNLYQRKNVVLSVNLDSSLKLLADVNHVHVESTGNVEFMLLAFLVKQISQL